MHRGEWLKEKMKETGYSYELVADLLELDRATVYRWTKKPDLSLSRMKVIADLCGIDLVDHFPEAKDLYKERPKDYRMLYFESLEKLQVLQEQIASYKAKEKQIPGQNRDKTE